MLSDLFPSHDPQKGKEITIIQPELAKAKKTVVRDFEKVMRSLGFWERYRWNKSDSIYTFSNGSYIEFIGLDNASIGKGFRRDVVYFNEVNKGGITLDSYMQFASRAAQVIADYNPDRRFWMHDEVITDPDTDFIILTYADNEYLPTKEKKEILKYKEKGFYDTDREDLFSPSNIKSKYWSNKWKVYGLGVEGAIDGVVFDNWMELERVPPLDRDWETLLFVL